MKLLNLARTSDQYYVILVVERGLFKKRVERWTNLDTCEEANSFLSPSLNDLVEEYNQQNKRNIKKQHFEAIKNKYREQLNNEE